MLQIQGYIAILKAVHKEKKNICRSIAISADVENTCYNSQLFLQFLSAFSSSAGM